MATATVAVIAATGLWLAAPAPSARAAQPARRAQPPATAERISLALDLHDGTVVQANGWYYMYGTQYGCGFTWGRPNTPFCGFGVSEATSLAGPWSAPDLLVWSGTIVAANWGPDNGFDWQWICSGASGAGCFNPRMVHTPQGQWLLWFNAPADRSRGSNPYWVLTCAGPAGPCSMPHKPVIYGACASGGDFSVITAGQAGYLLCAGTGRVLYTEALTSSWLDGTSMVSTAIETPPAEGAGAFQLPDGSWEVTYSDPNCGYCTGPPALKAAAGAGEVQVGYATAVSLLGPWTDHGPLAGSGNVIAWCTGQPRTVFTADGQPYEWMDRWTGTANEAAATEVFIPIVPGWTCT